MITKTKAIEAAGDIKAETKKAETAVVAPTIETIKETTAAAAAGVQQAQTQMKEGVDRAMKSAEHVVQFNQGNVEALVKSSQILAAGFQDMSKLMAANAKAAMDETMSTFKALSAVKSVKEALDLQTAFARTSMEKAMADSGKLTEHSLKVAEQAFAPITARVNAAVEVFS